MIVRKEKLIHCFDSGASTYDIAADVQVIAAQYLMRFLMDIRANQIFEIGCGTGLLTHYYADLFCDADILISDIAPAMVKASAARFSKNNHVKAVIMDGEQVPVTLRYDLLVSGMTFHWFHTLEASMTKMIDQLNSGGHLIFSCLGANSLMEWRKLCMQNQIMIGSPHFPHAEQLRLAFPELKIEVKQHTITYANLHLFLKTLKKLGAHATRQDYAMLSVTQMRRLIHLLNQPFHLTYELIYGTYYKR